DQSWRDTRSLASSGFRDTTRLALGSPEMHRDISMTNRAALSRWIGKMIETLDEFRANLDLDDETARQRIQDFFVEAQDARANAEATPSRTEEQSPESVAGLKNEKM